METNESISTQNIASTNVTAVQNANDYFDQLACSVSPVVTRTLKIGVDAIVTIASFAFQAGIGAKGHLQELRSSVGKRQASHNILCFRRGRTLRNT